MTHRTATQCSVAGCDRPYRCTGFCSPHYSRWRVYGDPQGNIPVRERVNGALCCIEDCAAPVRCKSMCAIHYERMRRSGRPDTPIPRPRNYCSVETCDRAAFAFGYCNAHHQRILKSGDVRAHIPLRKLPRGNERGDIKARILSQTIETPSGCLEWTGGVDPGGYGSISWNGRGWRVHRAMWTVTRGPIPEGDWTLDHLCYVRRCVNVEHLELVTRGENTMRAMLRKYAKAERLPEPVLEFLRAASRGTLEGRGFLDHWQAS